MKILKIDKDKIHFPDLITWHPDGYVIRHKVKSDLLIIGQAVNQICRE